MALSWCLRPAAKATSFGVNTGILATTVPADGNGTFTTIRARVTALGRRPFAIACARRTCVPSASTILYLDGQAWRRRASSEQRKRAFFIRRARNLNTAGPGAVARGPMMRGPAGRDEPSAAAAAAAKATRAAVMSKPLRRVNATISLTVLDF